MNIVEIFFVYNIVSISNMSKTKRKIKKKPDPD